MASAFVYSNGVQRQRRLHDSAQRSTPAIRDYSCCHGDDPSQLSGIVVGSSLPMERFGKGELQAPTRRPGSGSMRVVGELGISAPSGNWLILSIRLEEVHCRKLFVVLRSMGPTLEYARGATPPAPNR
jgi:hypothetical protein